MIDDNPSCYGTSKVQGDLTSELPQAHPDCVDCPVNTDCYYAFGQWDRIREIEKNVKERGILR